jgi:hypothetical protein
MAPQSSKEILMHYSPFYFGTLRKDDKELEVKLEFLREVADTSNETIRVFHRLGKGNPYRHLYSSKGGPLYRKNNMLIRPEHGTRLDVYFYPKRKSA